MPHCIIEYSESLSESVKIESLINTVFDAALSSELFQKPAIKVRAIPYSFYLNGASQFDHFLHVNVKILSGRTAEQKLSLSTMVFNALEALNIGNTSITVEISELDKDSYSRNI